MTPAQIAYLRRLAAVLNVDRELMAASIERHGFAVGIARHAVRMQAAPNN